MPNTYSQIYIQIVFAVKGRLNVIPSHFIYLGDTAIDMKTAIAADMNPVGALWGFRTGKELLENGAQALIKRPQEILNLLSLTHRNFKPMISPLERGD